MFLSEGGEEEKARESGKFKAEGDRSQIGGGRKGTWRTCFSRLSLYEYLMQGTKTDAVNSEKSVTAENAQRRAAHKSYPEVKRRGGSYSERQHVSL